jgi:hypothetical protein
MSAIPAKAVALTQYKALPIGPPSSHSKTRHPHSHHRQPTQLPPLTIPQTLPFFIKEIMGLRSLPLHTLKIVIGYSDVLYFHEQMRKIENLFKANFTEKFAEATFDLLPLHLPFIPGFCLADPTIAGFTKIVLTRTIILAINELFPFITEFSGDAARLSDDDLNYFHHFKNLTSLTLDNCRHITYQGMKNLYTSKQLKHVVLNGSDFLVDKKMHPRTSQVTKSFSNNASIWADLLLEEHACLLTFEADGLKKELAKPTDDEFEQMLAGMSKLSILPSFGQESCRNLTDRSLKLLGEKCARLEQLLLFDCRNFTLQGVKEIAKLPRLKMVSLYGCKQVDEVAASRLFPHLKSGVTCTISKDKD